MSEAEAVESPGGAAREEAARQLVALAVTVMTVPLLVWLERAASDPDMARTMRMRAARVAERVAARAAAAATLAAGKLWEAAERARVAYEAERA